jgi:hypothetical protein
MSVKHTGRRILLSGHFQSGGRLPVVPVVALGYAVVFTQD